ncbi:MAG: hypothetical protein OXG24_03005 [Gammaproteobacteria bacterium]|nr:hypothetical protein [Gammaproteobacteria bacterium]
MKFSISRAKFVGILALTFILGIGSASVVSWLLLSPISNNQIADFKVPSPAEVNENVALERGNSSELSRSPSPTIEAIRSFDDLDEIKSSFARGLALRNFLAAADEERVVGLVVQTEGVRPNTARHTWHMSVVQRLAQLNPQRALSTVLEMQSESYWPGQFVAGIFREWAQSNLEEAVSHAGTLDENWRESALRAIVEERSDLSDEVLRTIAKDLGNEKIAVAAILQHRIENEIENPAEAWNELAIELQDDGVHMWSIARIASAWVKKSGLSAMDQIAQSLTNVEARRIVISQALPVAADTDPEGAFRYALTIENDQYNQIVGSVLRIWTRSDPHSALAAVSDIENETQRRDLVESVVREWSRFKPQEVLESIDILPEFVQPSAVETALREIAEDSPKEAAILVAGMKAGPNKTAAASGVASSWIDRDYKAGLDWILNEPAIEDLRTQLLDENLLHLIRVDPNLAMSTALAQPVRKVTHWRYGEIGMEVGMELRVIASLSFTDMDQAIELLPRVREGLTRLKAYSQVGASLVHKGSTEEALDMVQQVPESQRIEYYTAVATQWATSDPEGLLNSMNRFPSNEVKSKAAMVLVKENRLTSEQTVEAKKFLLVADSKALD